MCKVIHHHNSMSVPWQGQDGHLNPREPAAECPEEPAVPAAGARQHPEGAARGAAPPAAALHRYHPWESLLPTSAGKAQQHKPTSRVDVGSSVCISWQTG